MARAIRLPGLKSYAGGAGGINFHVLLYDTSDEFVDGSVIEANRMGQIQDWSGVWSGDQVHGEARMQRRWGVIGSGYQAETQLAAIAHVREDQVRQGLQSVREENRAIVTPTKNVGRVGHRSVRP